MQVVHMLTSALQTKLRLSASERKWGGEKTLSLPLLCVTCERKKVEAVSRLVVLQLLFTNGNESDCCLH